MLSLASARADNHLSQYNVPSAPCPAGWDATTPMYVHAGLPGMADFLKPTSIPWPKVSWLIVCDTDYSGRQLVGMDWLPDSSLVHSAEFDVPLLCSLVLTFNVNYLDNTSVSLIGLCEGKDLSIMDPKACDGAIMKFSSAHLVFSDHQLNAHRDTLHWIS